MSYEYYYFAEARGNHVRIIKHHEGGEETIAMDFLSSPRLAEDMSMKMNLNKTEDR
jgi:hypothetical protein